VYGCVSRYRYALRGMDYVDELLIRALMFYIVQKLCIQGPIAAIGYVYLHIITSLTE